MKFYFYVGILCTILAMAGCEKSFERFEPVDVGGNSDSAWVSADAGSLLINQLHQELAPAITSDSFNLQQGTTMIATGNSRVSFPANAFQANGSTASGMALGRFLLLQAKGDYIRFRKSTTSNGYLIQNKAVIYLDVSRNGQSLTLAPNRTLSVVIRNPLGSTGATGFYGTSTTSSGFTSYNWVADTSVNVYPDTNGYVIVTRRLQWQSAGWTEDTTVVKSRMVVSMPAAFTNANTSVFMVYNNKQSVVQLTPDAANRIWLAEKVPLGEPVVLVTLTKRTDGYWLGAQQVLTTQNQNVRITAQQSSLLAIDTYLNSL